MNNTPILSFLQDNRLFYVQEETVSEIKLRKSSIGGRHCILTYALFLNRNFMIYSADYCVSMVVFDKESYKYNESVALNKVKW